MDRKGLHHPAEGFSIFSPSGARQPALSEVTTMAAEGIGLEFEEPDLEERILEPETVTSREPSAGPVALEPGDFELDLSDAHPVESSIAGEISIAAPTDSLDFDDSHMEMGDLEVEGLGFDEGSHAAEEETESLELNLEAPEEPTLALDEVEGAEPVAKPVTEPDSALEEDLLLDLGEEKSDHVPELEFDLEAPDKNGEPILDLPPEDEADTITEEPAPTAIEDLEGESPDLDFGPEEMEGVTSPYEPEEEVPAAVQTEENPIKLELDAEYDENASPPSEELPPPIEDLGLSIEEDKDAPLKIAEEKPVEVEIEDLGLSLEENQDAPLKTVQEDAPPVEIEDLGLELEIDEDEEAPPKSPHNPKT